MGLTRGRILLLLIAASAFFGWKNLADSDSAVLHIPPARQSRDTYVKLWFVEDDRDLWIRAEDRERLWLGLLEGSPEIELTRRGHTVRYRAEPMDTPDAQAYVDRLFLEKYGLLDRLRGSLLPRDSVPIRLERP